MKLSNFLFIALVGVFLTVLACNNKKVDPATQQTTSSPGDSTLMDPAVAATPTDGNTEFHFICPNKCKGSGGPQVGRCPVCGSEYVHNDAFHKGSPAPPPAMKIDSATNTAVPTSTQAQNAKGVYHFICPKGHEGGAGIAGNCSKCGTPLEHNQAFHNN